jgi:hypothetical protein
MSGEGADPLSVLAVGSMAILLIILFVTLGLAVRAGVGRRLWTPEGSQTINDIGLVDTCARTFALVLMSLLGLFALGVTYGNVLGAGAP